MVSRPAPASAALPPMAGGDAPPGFDAFGRAVLEDVRDAVFLQDAAGVLRWANPAARTLTGDIEPKLHPVAETSGHVEVTGHRHPARVRALPGGWHAWTVAGPEGESVSPRRHVGDFLAGAGPRLAAARGRHGTARVIAELAAAALAETVFVLLPTTRGRWEWWSCEPPAAHGHGRIRRVPPQVAPVLAATFGATGRPQPVPVPAAEVATLPSIVADRFADHTEVTAVSLGPSASAGVTGALLLGRRADPEFGGEQDRAVVEFAKAAGTALANAQRYARQEEATRGLETTLRPIDPPELAGTRFETWYEPAGGVLAVGGDFYDVLPHDDGSAFLVLGDICGKGAEAAALTGRVRHALTALAMVERDGRTLLRLLNELLIAGGSSRFATLVLGTATPTDEGVDLTLASGGHPAPLIVRHAGGVEEVTVPGTLVGISPQARFAEATVRLGPGDMCLLYTDGITEARNRHDPSELFGDDRLRAVLTAAAGQPAREVVRQLRQAVRDWLGSSAHDDIAVLAVECAD
ncbi:MULTISPECIES: SpoIIE family protein phosphatase [unclassified Amycolatopsis]|uniref:SpoIIE family protein phosphatase n=1 Tax=unclassified Amycolatopsis TaxID=2618356 RepID=UPI002E13DB5B|nr:MULTISPECIES: SpoIIE family protein phosphatase [unclassified Amycolatopsis]WSJ72911.1 SpoIIE family protein phosphatase [Amycolatopsis sp. NBC_01307]WSK83367.1 SpoIIE family protein phosphatase [Amycolatopsis sp. NBC_01286]